jgi:type VII secretion integral membrane protein EccD
MEERTQHRMPAPVRLRFVLGMRAADLAVPAQVALADVLPSVLPGLSPAAADQGGEHDGWVVQRLGGPPLDEERTAAELNLLDGETVYVRPRAAELPQIDFDDLVDGVAEQVRGSAAAWSPRRLRGMLVGCAGATLLLAMFVLWLDGPIGFRALTASLVSALLLVGAGLSSRGAADPLVGIVLAAAAVAHAGTAGWLGARWAAPEGGWPAAAACTAIAVLTAVGVGFATVADGALLFSAALAFAGTLCLPAAVAVVGGVPPQHAAAIGLVVSLVLALFVPVTAFRLGGLRLPLLPGTARELTDDIAPVPHQLVLARGAATVRYLAALGIGVGAAQLLLTGPLVVSGGGWPLLLALAAAAWLLIRTRHVTTAVHRWALLVPAAALAGGAAVRYAADQDFFNRATLVLPALVLVGALLAVGSGTMPGRRFAPYWGRAVEILETFVAVAMLPLLGAVLDVYQAVRAWTGG